MTMNEAAPSPVFRRDVEGLRAIAVVMVLLYHLGVGWAHGGFAGVDVFFVISGFLITGLLIKEAERTGSIDLLGFYARRAKRLFPAAATVLGTTMVLAFSFLPETQWSETGGDIFASALYFINWRLAARSVDYLAEDSLPSAVQHFWSLAVEEQYYIVWPLVLLAGLLLARRFVSTKRTVWAALILVGVPSFVWSIHLTRADSAQAYFVSTTRMWELAIGGAVAAAAAIWPRIGRSWALAIGWLGVGAIFASLLLQSTSTPWPGYAAALPTLGAAAVIVAGYSAGGYGPAAMLGSRPMCWIGGLSYSLYLWHWPLIAVATAYYDGELSAGHRLAILAATFLLSWLTQRFIENPVRYSQVMSANPRYALSTGLNFSFVGAISGLLLIALAAGHRGDAPVRAAALGARVLKENPRDDPSGRPVDKVGWMTPSPGDAIKDIPDLYARGCQSSVAATEPVGCEYGDRRASTTIAVVGDSKIAQWMPALQMLARDKHWRVMAYTKSGCGFHSATLQIKGRPYTQCDEWNRKLLSLLIDEAKPDFVLTSQGRSTLGEKPGDAADDGVVDGLVAWWTRLDKAGIKVIALADNPHPGRKVYECVAQHPDELTACAFNKYVGGGTPALEAAARRVPNARFIDLTDAICPTAKCAPVIGNVLIYRQGSHITKTYIESMADRLGAELEKAGVGGDGSIPAKPAGKAADDALASQALPLPRGMTLPMPHELRDYQETLTKRGDVRHRTVVDFLEGDVAGNYERTNRVMSMAGYRPAKVRSSQRMVVATFRQANRVPIRVSIATGASKSPATVHDKGTITIEWQDGSTKLNP